MGTRSRPGKSTKTTTKATSSAKCANSPTTPAKCPDTKSQSLWAKVCSKDVQLTTEEALRAAHWIRQCVGLVIGLVFGFIPLTGAPAILCFFLAATAAPPAIMSISNELDTEEIGKTAPIQFEGLMPATALFLLTWIVSFTVFLPPTS